jgi:hypothetical protein
MKRFSQQFKKQSESIRMRASERNELRERLVSYMEYHPLPAEVASRKGAQKTLESIISEPFVAIKVSSLYLRSFAGVFAIFLILGVPFVAERSMPGDILYPVKVQFNEEVRSGLSFSPYAKVAWETERLERRIAEARLLASAGKLTEEKEQEVAEAVKTHTDAAQREIAELRESDSDEAAIAEIALASALAVQTEVLENHTENTVEGEEGQSVAALAQAVAEARNTAEASQTGALPSYDKLLGRVEAESTNIYELFASVKNDATEEEMKNVERRLSDIERKIAKANDLREGTTTVTASTTIEAIVPENDAEREKREGEAIEILRSALTDIQKLMNYMTHIDVRRNVSLEELVPVTLTPEEQSLESTRLLNEIVALQATIGTKEVNGGLEEKVSVGQQDLEIKVTAAVDLIQAENYDAALLILREAHLIATDLHTLTENKPEKAAVILPVETGTTTPTL